MRKRVAVEEDLGPFVRALGGAGYDVVPLSRDSREAGLSAHAVVISGRDRNIAGRQDIVTGAPVLNASGATPEQVVKDIRGLIGDP